MLDEDLSECSSLLHMVQSIVYDESDNDMENGTMSGDNSGRYSVISLHSLRLPSVNCTAHPVLIHGCDVGVIVCSLVTHKVVIRLLMTD